MGKIRKCGLLAVADTLACSLGVMEILHFLVKKTRDKPDGLLPDVSQDDFFRIPHNGFRFTGDTGDDGEAIAALLSMEPEILGALTVVPRTAALDAIFAEHYFQLAGLTDSDTIAGIGRLLNADYVLSGSIRQLGERSLVIATVVNVETFEQVAGYYRTYCSR